MALLFFYIPRINKVLIINNNHSPARPLARPLARSPARPLARISCSLADILSTPLKMLFNKSLCEGIVPIQWVEACITAIHKKGLKSAIGNYRPVSITSVICKMMESFIRDHIIDYMVSNNYTAEEQHGFVPRRERMTNLLPAMDDWTKAIDFGHNIDVIFTDFAKAFDSVPHKRLLVKLEGQVLRWLKAFLTGKRHRVNVEGELSDWVYAKSGIPQGSVLGPSLFVIFINDLPLVIKNSCKMFADDTKLYRTIITEDDTTSLQDDIDSLVDWSAFWQLPVNELKCKCMHIGKDRTSRSYQINDHVLENVKEQTHYERTQIQITERSAVYEATKVSKLFNSMYRPLE